MYLHCINSTWRASALKVNVLGDCYTEILTVYLLQNYVTYSADDKLLMTAPK